MINYLMIAMTTMITVKVVGVLVLSEGWERWRWIRILFYIITIDILTLIIIIIMHFFIGKSDS